MMLMGKYNNTTCSGWVHAPTRRAASSCLFRIRPNWGFKVTVAWKDSGGHVRGGCNEIKHLSIHLLREKRKFTTIAFRRPRTRQAMFFLLIFLLLLFPFRGLKCGKSGWELRFYCKWNSTVSIEVETFCTLSRENRNLLVAFIAELDWVAYLYCECNYSIYWTFNFYSKFQEL